jgi:hypothetical protein
MGKYVGTTAIIGFVDALDSWLLDSDLSLPTNKAGMWLIKKGIQVYIGAREVREDG